MKRHVIARLGIVLLSMGVIMSLIACVPVKNSQQTQQSTDGLAYQSDIKDLREEIGKKADYEAVKLLVGSGGAINTYKKEELYTRAEVDELIKKLKDDQSWVKTTSPGSPGTSPSAPIGTFGITSNLGSDQVALNGNVIPLTITITNNTGANKYVKPQITLSASQTCTVNYLPTEVTITPTGWSATLGLSIIPTSGSNSSSILIVPTAGGARGDGLVYIENGKSQEFWVSLKFTTTCTSWWQIAFSYVAVNP